MKTKIGSAVIALLCTTLPSQGSEIVILDDFDDGTLDPSWEVTFQDAHGWTWTEAGTELSVMEIDPAVVNHAGGGTWAFVTLRRPCALPGDFHAEMEFSWDCVGVNAAMQIVRIRLVDAGDQPLCTVGFCDWWINAHGCRYAHIGAEFLCVANELPYMGAAVAELERVGDEVTVLWNGAPILSGSMDAPVERVDLVFGFYAYSGVNGTSVFGSESVGLVRIEGEPVGTDPTTWGKTKSLYR